MLLIDTNVVSELRKVRSGKADPRVADWSERVDAADLHLSVISLQELEIGILQVSRRDAPQGRLLRAWLEQQLLPAFAGRILPITAEIARRSAPLHVPDPLPVRDGLIAATALVHRMAVVTRNVGDFQRTGAAVINPWAESVES
jgi:toxin FitB